MTPTPTVETESRECLTPGCQYDTRIVSYDFRRGTIFKLAIHLPGPLKIPEVDGWSGNGTKKRDAFLKLVEDTLHKYMEAAVADIGQLDLANGGTLAKSWPIPIGGGEGALVVSREPTETDGPLQKALRVAADHVPSDELPGTMIRAEFVVTVIRAYLAALPSPATGGVETGEADKWKVCAKGLTNALADERDYTLAMRSLVIRSREYVADAVDAHRHSDGVTLIEEIDATLASKGAVKPLSTYPEDHARLLMLARKVVSETEDENASELADLVRAILEDERTALASPPLIAGPTKEDLAERIYRSVAPVFEEISEPSPSDYLPVAAEILALFNGAGR